MNEQPVIAGIVKNTRFLGDLVLPCIYRQDSPHYYTVDGLLAAEDISLYSDTPDYVRELHALGNTLDPVKLTKRFTKAKVTAAEFFDSKDKKVINQLLMPFVWKQTDRMLQIMQANDIPIYDARVTWPNIYLANQVIPSADTPEPRLHFNRTDDGTYYTLRVYLNNEQVDLQAEGNLLLGLEPCHLISGNKLLSFESHISGKLLTPFLTKTSLHIPKHIEKDYFKKFIQKVASRVDVEAEGFEVIDEEFQVKANLSIEADWQGHFGFMLSFSYGDRHIFPNNPQKVFTSLHTSDGGFVFKRFQRDTGKENQLTSLLKKTGLKQHGSFFRPPGPASNILDFIPFVLTHKNRLESAGFSISQDKQHTFSLEKPQIVMDHSRTNDWFDLHIRVKAGAHYFPFMALRKHILAGDKVYELSDGTRFLIPDEWFERYKGLFVHGHEHEGGLRLGPFHNQLLHELGVGSGEVQALPGPVREYKGLPDLQDVKLRPYQETGFHWMRDLADKGLGGILADDMGLGKTLQVITRLADYFRDAPEDKQATVTEKSSETLPTGKQLKLFDESAKDAQAEHYALHGHPPALVIMPTSIIHNWVAELRRFAPYLKVLVYAGSNRELSSKQINTCHLVLTTYGILRNDIDILKAYRFCYVILDESQNIKNPASQTARAAFSLNGALKLALTGTPVENRLTDLWSQLHLVNPGMPGKLADFVQYYANPIEKDPHGPEAARLLQLTKPFILRRLKEQVASELPPLSETTIYCDMTESQSSLYEQEKSRFRNLVLEAMVDETARKGTPMMVLKALMKLRQFANHPKIADPGTNANSGKFDMLTDILDTVVAEGHKVLIFSSFVSHLDLVEAYCQQNSMPYVKLTGSSTRREDIIKEFRQKSEVQVFLISLKAGGVGLNLTEAGYVFMLDPWWNPAAEMQAINRAHRIGQDKNVFVYRFISKDTVEEKIVQLQQRKQTLTKSVISQSQFISGLTKEELTGLFS